MFEIQKNLFSFHRTPTAINIPRYYFNISITGHCYNTKVNIAYMGYSPDLSDLSEAAINRCLGTMAMYIQRTCVAEVNKQDQSSQLKTSLSSRVWNKEKPPTTKPTN